VTAKKATAADKTRQTAKKQVGVETGKKAAAKAAKSRSVKGEKRFLIRWIMINLLNGIYSRLTGDFSRAVRCFSVMCGTRCPRHSRAGFPHARQKTAPLAISVRDSRLLFRPAIFREALIK